LVGYGLNTRQLQKGYWQFTAQNIEKTAKSQFFDIIYGFFIRLHPETIEKTTKSQFFDIIFGIFIRLHLKLSKKQ